jgi:hypothetical protein
MTVEQAMDAALAACEMIQFKGESNAKKIKALEVYADIVRADERAKADARWEKRMGELADKLDDGCKFRNDYESGEDNGLRAASYKLTAAIAAAKESK